MRVPILNAGKPSDRANSCARHGRFPACCHLRNREHQRQIFIRFECFFFTEYPFSSPAVGGFYLLCFVLLIHFLTIWWRGCPTINVVYDKLRTLTIPSWSCRPRTGSAFALPHGHPAGGPEQFAAPGAPASACGRCTASAVQAEQARCPEDVAHVVEQTTYRQQELRLVPLILAFQNIPSTGMAIRMRDQPAYGGEVLIRVFGVQRPRQNVSATRSSSVAPRHAPALAIGHGVVTFSESIPIFTSFVL